MYKKRHAFILLICFLSMIYAIKYPLYNSLNVTRPGGRQLETLGVPLGIIGNAAKESPELLDKDILDFAYSIAPSVIWKEKFSILNGGFSTIKFVYNITDRNISDKEELKKAVNLGVVESTGWLNVLKMMFRCIREAPFASLRGFCGITSIVYSIAGPPLGRIVPAIAPNDLGLTDNKFLDLSYIYKMVLQLISSTGADEYQISQSGGEFRFTGFNEGGAFTLQSLIILCNYGVMVLFKHLFWCIGVLNLVIVIFIMSRLNFNKKADWRKLFLSLPMLVHNYGTMLLLGGNDFRILYHSYLVTPLIILLLIRDDEEETV